jgi:ElaA protein
MTLRCVTGDALTAQDVYDVWKIRDQVFAFEQHVEDTDVDDRDLLPTTTHLWMADAEGPTTYLRVFVEGGVRHVGRVCTRKDQRGQGLSSRLMTEISRLWEDEDLHLNAQSYLERWYESFGYARSGVDFEEAGIVHTPMVREAKA